MKKLNILESKEYSYAIKKIYAWSKSNKKILNIISSPFNSLSILKPLINETIRNKGRILYISGDKRSFVDLIKGTLIESLKIKYFFYEDEKVEITCLNFDESISLNHKYNLIIIDEISSINTSKKLNLSLLVELLYNKADKIVSYGIDNITSYGEHLEICNIENNKPILEPRIITTKINLVEDIPFTLYEYLNWFNKRKRKVLIIVRDVEKYSEIILKYIKQFKLNNIKIVNIKKETDKIININLYKEKCLFIVTNYIDNYIKNIKNLDVVILDSDQNIYSYKTIVYLSTIVSINSKEGGEVLLIANNVSTNMETAQNIVRNFNKLLWEKGFLNY